MDSMTLTNSTGLIPAVADYLCNQFDIINGFSLLNYDSSMQSLNEELILYKSYCFSPEQRLVFTLYDTDYYFLESQIGFTAYNLLQILVDLDISVSHCILFTNHIGLRKELNNLCFNHFLLQDHIKVFENNYSKSFLATDQLNFNRSSDEIEFYFCFLSHAKRNHRLLTRIFLKENNIDSKTLLAWHSNQKFLDLKIINNAKHRKSKNSHEFVYPYPFTRIRDKIYTDFRFKDLQSKFDAVEQTEINQKIQTSPNEQNLRADFLRSCFINLVTETVFDFPYPYITEKTFKCFWHRSPFIIIGAPNSIKHLQSLGFKTFSDFWDESYDLEFDANNRLIKIFDVIKLISNWSLSDCKIVYNNMLSILNYNHKHYSENYIANDLQKFLVSAKF